MFSSLFSNNTQKFTKYLWIYFIIVFFVNFIFKISYLGYASFWYDEIISVQSASLDFGHIKHVSEWDKNPPFYYYCLSVWIKLFNDTEYTVRLLSVIFSSLAAGILFLISNKYFNKITAIIASLLFLSSNVLFYYSHEARAYSLVLLLALLSTLLYFKLKERPTIKYVALLSIINFLLIYTHYIAGLMLVFQTVLMLFYFDKKQKKYFLFSLLIIVLLTALRFTKKQFSLIIDFNSSTSSFWLKKSDTNYLKEVISTFLFNEYISIFFLGIIVIIFALLLFKRLKTAQFNVAYSLCIGFGSIVCLFVLGKITPIFLDRYLIFSLPFIYILIAYGLSFVKNKYISLSVIYAFFVFSMFNIDYKTNKGMDYKAVVKFINSIKDKDDLIIVKTKDIKPLYCYYYDKDFFRKQKKDLPQEDRIIFCNTWQDIGMDINSFKRIIVVDSYQEYNPNEKDFVLKLSEQKTNYFITNYFKGVKISFYK
jgi:uncharacterized membrane protein